MDAKRQAEHEKKTAEVRAAMAERRHLKEMEKYELEKKDDELRCYIVAKNVYTGV